MVREGTVAQIKEGMEEEWKVSLMKVTERAEALDSLRSSIWTPVLSLRMPRSQEWCLISRSHPDVPFKGSPSDSPRGWHAKRRTGEKARTGRCHYAIYNLSCPGVSYVDQAGLETTEVCFLLPPKHWE